MKNKTTVHFHILQKANLFNLVVLGLFGFSVLAHHKSVETRGFIFNWSGRYFFFILLPLFFFWVAQILFLNHERFRSSFSSKTRKYQSFGILSLCLVFSVVLRVNVYQAQVLFFIFSILAMLLLLSFSFNIKELMLTYLCFSILGCLLFAFELPQLMETRRNKHLVHWSTSSMFRYMFPNRAPFIGLGGRLNPNLRLRLSSSDADFLGVRFVTNQWGFRNEEDFPQKPIDHEVRILNEGDSFSNGYGIDQSKFFGRLLEEDLQNTFSNRKILVMNTEVSDPAYGLYYLQNYGTFFSPRIILYGMCGNDEIQTYLHTTNSNVFVLQNNGNLIPANQNLSADSTFRAHKSLYWEQIKSLAYPKSTPFLPSRIEKNYLSAFLLNFQKFRAITYIKRFSKPVEFKDDVNELSYFMTISDSPIIFQSEHTDRRKRFIDGYRNIGFYYKKEIPEVERIHRQFYKVISSMAMTAKKNGQFFLLIYFPDRIQTQPKDWKLYQNVWNLDPNDFDLDLPNQKIASYCQRHGIPFLDLTPHIRKATSGSGGSLYLPNDVHLNEKGYAVAAREVSNVLAETTEHISPGS